MLGVAAEEDDDGQAAPPTKKAPGVPAKAHIPAGDYRCMVLKVVPGKLDPPPGQKKIPHYITFQNAEGGKEATVGAWSSDILSVASDAMKHGIIVLARFEDKGGYTNVASLTPESLGEAAEPKGGEGLS